MAVVISKRSKIEPQIKKMKNKPTVTRGEAEGDNEGKKGKDEVKEHV